MQVGKKIASYYNAEFTVMTFDDNLTRRWAERKRKFIYCQKGWKSLNPWDMIRLLYLRLNRFLKHGRGKVFDVVDI